MIKRMDATFWGTVLSLYLFWILVTDSFHYQELITGFLCSLLVGLFNNELLFRKNERPLLSRQVVLWGLRYFGDLLVSIFIANLQVAVLALSPKMPISPGVVRFQVKLKKSLTRAILANSITLTPGTLTIQVGEGEYLVHALTRKNAEEVVRWKLSEELCQIEEGKKRR